MQSAHPRCFSRDEGLLFPGHWQTLGAHPSEDSGALVQLRSLPPGHSPAEEGEPGRPRRGYCGREQGTWSPGTPMTPGRQAAKRKHLQPLCGLVRCLGTLSSAGEIQHQGREMGRLPWQRLCPQPGEITCAEGGPHGTPSPRDCRAAPPVSLQILIPHIEANGPETSSVKVRDAK